MRRKIRFGLLLVLGVLLLAGEWPRPSEEYRLEFHIAGAYPAHYPVMYLQGEEVERSLGQMLTSIPGQPNLVAILSSSDGTPRQEWRWVNGAWQRTDKKAK